MADPQGKSQDLGAIIKKHRPSLGPYEDIYRQFHSHPELSTLEVETASSIHSHLGAMGDYEIKKDIGGHGTAAILRNGDGPTLLLRADIDGLPVLEKSGLAYASKARMRDTNGIEQPVMHACGHDMHITALLAAAQLLHSARSEWAGTLVLVFQPAEEKGVGAQSMIDDGLYTRHGVPEPDVVIGAHVMPERAGRVGVRPKVMMATADSMKITLHGRGGHASQPHMTIDPVVMAAYAVTRLQTVVGREVAPNDPAVVTVSSIHAGDAENIIAEYAELKLNVRTFDEGKHPSYWQCRGRDLMSLVVRNNILAGIKRIVQSECDASGASKSPEYASISSFPITHNDPQITTTLSKSMSDYFGDSFNPSFGPLNGSEDFSILGTAIGKPTCFWVYGGVDPATYDDLEKKGKLNEVPVNHSAYFAPVIQPTLTVAVDGYALSALTWLLKK